MHPDPLPRAADARICLCVDDFGLTDGIGEASLLLAQMERVHAIGCMVGAPRWLRWKHQARGLDATQVDVGLHLDLSECPLLPGTRQPVAQWIMRSYGGLLHRRAVQAEICAQLDAFEEALDRPPAYVDGHQHVHQLPQVRDALVDALQQRYTQKQRPWLRYTAGAAGLPASAYGGWRGWAKARLIAALGSQGLQALAQRNGFAHNPRLLGVYGFDAGTDGYLALLKAGLLAGGDGSLWMCHPSSSAEASDPISAARLAEFEVLRGPACGQLLAQQGVRLQSMGRTLAQGCDPAGRENAP